MSGVQQAVILCGGRGERLKPLTDTMPKPMAPANGRPFLEYIVCQLRDQGVRRVLLLTGYLGEQISAYFGDGARFGVEIGYSHGPTEWETGKRVWEARALLEPRFLLLYSDNFTPFDLARLETFHAERDVALSLLVHAKSPGNIRVDPDGRIPAYDSSRQAEGLDYVEIGYMLAERERTLAALTEPDASFSRVLRRLAADGQLAGQVSGDAYHSVSDPARWKLAERYLAPKKILLVDRDGTLNERAPRGEYVSRWEDVRLIEPTVDALAELAADGFRFVLISNQAGIARGMVSAAAVDDINARIAEHLKARGAEVIGTYVCPHHWDEGCDCRKPAPGLFFRAARDHLIRLDRTIYVGDDPRDAEAARNALSECVLIGPERDLPGAGGVRPNFASETLPGAVAWIKSRFDAWANTGV
ncbi:MAG TPA: HAD-IIIA family hydrolase [Caulobacteraceae bacterium]|jgi:D-glycero-D-manno-heptose 1,7-bisphosphate phosphatase